MLTVTNSIAGWTYENTQFTHIAPKELKDYVAFFATKAGIDIIPYIYILHKIHMYVDALNDF